MKLDILAFGAHPDDVELGCGGTILKAVAQGKKVGIIDLTSGEMGSRGSAKERMDESKLSSKILGVNFRKNLFFEDAFIVNDKIHQLEVVKIIRNYRPDVVLCNARTDRHIDHSKSSELIINSCFLSGLRKVKTKDENNIFQESFRPRHLFHYIQWYDLTPDFVIDISGYLEKKIESIKAYKSQFYNPKSNEPETPISTLNFMESVSSRAKNLGRLIYKDAGEGFTTNQYLALENFDPLL